MERPGVCSRWAAAGGWIVLGCISLSAAFAQAPPGVPQRAKGMQVQIRRGQQVPVRPVAAAGAEDEAGWDGVFLPPDRSAKRRLDLAQQMLDDRRFGEGVRLLGSLLENTEDFFFKPDAEQPVFRSLKAEAGRLISKLSAEGRESYELQFGARARQLLTEGSASGNLGTIAEVSRQFFHTQAGQEATFLLGRHHLDQNRPLAAALSFERLRESAAASERFEPVLSLSLATCWQRAGKSEKAKETLVRLKRAGGSGKILVAGKPVKLFSNDSQALAWLEETLGPQRPLRPQDVDQWAMYRGDESRNAASLGGRPLLSVRWRQRTTDDRAIEKFVTKARSDYASQEIVALPSMHPLAVGDVVVMRTAFALEAVDFQNGKLVWKYPTTDDSFEQFSKVGNSQQPTSSTQQLFAGLDQRVWEDAIYGTLSSDTAQVYFIEGLGLAGVNSNLVMTVLPNGRRRYSVNSRGSNRLAARELRTQGKLKWEVGGVTGEDEPKLAGAFFLGPPLPLLGHLYVMAEMRGQEIRLVALSPKTGALEWSQQLAVVEQSVTSDGFRRNAGATPSFADGVLVCPTSAGAVVGMDLTTRSLLWGYQYPRASQYATERFINGRMTVYPGGDRRGSERWADATVTIVDGRVLVTPVETDQIYCLDLSDGRELWKQPRGGSLYVGCVHRERAILVGRGGMTALRMTDGEKAWPGELELPPGSLPSGRGFYSGNHYYLPVSSAEVLKINLDSGKVEERARSRSGIIPGNLVCHRGSIISQGADYVDAFFQLDTLKEQIARVLEKQPEDPAALANLGEVKLDEGKLAEAVELFRRSYRLRPDDTTREQLVESLLASLNTDFAAHRDSLDELGQLVDQPEHRVEFLRLKAQGLQAGGDVAAAFKTYMQLADLPAPSTLDSIDERWSVRRDRWIRGQLESLRTTANAQQGAAIDAAANERLQAALAAQSNDALRGYLALFGTQPPAETARKSLVEQLTGDDLLERNLLLRKAERSTDEAQAGAATARLAKLLSDAGRAELAGIYYRLLAGRFAQVKCEDGKTGEQIVAALPPDDPARKPLAAQRPWPRGKVTSREDKPLSRAVVASRIQRTIDLEIVGPSNPLFQDVSILYDAQQHLVAQNEMGEKRFRIPLFEQGGRRLTTINRNAYNAPALTYASVNGGLLVLSLGNQLVAVDTLRAGEGASNRVLWTQDLNDQAGGFTNNQGVLARPVNLPWGGLRHVPEDAYGHRFGSIGPLGDDGVCFQRLHDLCCVDPLTGKPVWTRKNVGLGNDLFGDEELLFVAPPGDADTMVLRASTGESLGVRRVAPFDRRMATLGRRVLSWEPQNVMQMRDVWQGQTQWSHTFAPGSKAALVGQEAVGVYQPNGEFTLITLADGKVLVKEQLQAESSLLGIFLLRTAEGYLLIANVAARNEPNVSVQPIPAAPNSLISGQIYAFERGTGKKLWPAPLPVSQHGLLTNQPSGVPVLVMARQVHRLGPVSPREPKTSVLCIDKRTGKVVYQNDQLPGSTVASFEVLGDPAARTVTIGLPSRSITLTFTDEPADPQAAAGGATQASFARLVSQVAQRAAEAIEAAVQQNNDPFKP